MAYSAKVAKSQVAMESLPLINLDLMLFLSVFFLKKNFYSQCFGISLKDFPFYIRMSINFGLLLH